MNTSLFQENSTLFLQKRRYERHQSVWYCNQTKGKYKQAVVSAVVGNHAKYEIVMQN